MPGLGPLPYVQASGAELPFRDDAFHTVVSSDTLEHIPRELRKQFLQELARVAKSYVIVSGPYDTPGTAHAEKCLRGLMNPDSPSFRWFQEHAEFGLPSLAETQKNLEELGGSAISGESGAHARWSTGRNECAGAAGEAGQKRQYSKDLDAR